MSKTEEYRAGHVALIGRPNVGKSTLLNALLGQKISITSHKPQTTRHRILGIKTVEHTQFVYVDTPGIHGKEKRAVNRYMNRAASSILDDVDVIVFLVEAMCWGDDDALTLKALSNVKSPVVLAVNKVDKIKDKEKLLPFLKTLSEKFPFSAILPISAYRDDNLEELEKTVRSYLPVSVALYPDDQITDRSERFMAAEIIREKLMRRLNEELPYALTVEIEQFKTENDMLRIAGLIWVERDNQKSIVIGKQGSMLKSIGRESRIDMENLFSQRVYLQLWVKVKEGWSDDERALNSLGYRDEN